MAKRRLTAAQKKRSDAAKRGAETRARNAAIAAALARKRSLAAKKAAATRKRNAATSKKAEPAKKPRGRARKLSIAEKFALFGGGGAVVSKERLAKIEEGLRVMREHGAEWVRRDGTVATVPNMLRHSPNAIKLILDLERVAGLDSDSFWRQLHGFAVNRSMTLKEVFRLARESQEGPFSARFRRLARKLATVHAVPLREVYTLWFSP